MIKLMGIITYRKANVKRVKLTTMHSNEKPLSFDLNQPTVINYGFLVSSLVQEYGVTPQEITIPSYIMGCLPIKD